MTTKQQITAVITDRRGRVLSIGQNSYVKTHPYQAELARRVGEPHKVFLHAEVHAITRLRDITKAHKISIYRYDSKGQPILARPCSICATAIQAAGIGIVEHT